MKICIDTTVILDILKNEFIEYQDKLYLALSKKEELVIPTIVLAELSHQFKGDERLLYSFLSDHKIKVEPLDADRSLSLQQVDG